MTKNLLAANSNLIGTVLLGRYRVVCELAKGGMGVVYLARSEGAVGFVKPVVIKLILPEHAEDRRFLGMFAREAQILAHLRHPSIATVLDFGEQDGAYVMVLEYVRGYHLGQWTRYLRLKQRKVPADIALQLTIDVLDALHHAHVMVHPDGTSMQIVHRDVSPSNVLLDEDGRARLLDFGVARMRGGDVNYQTQVKGFVGKLMYSAPEVFSEGDSTPSSDAYSCAVVLHEMLLGRNTFRGDNQAKTLHNVLGRAPELIEPLRDDVPLGLDAVLAKALAKTPAQRYASAHDFAAALRGLQQDAESEVRARMAALVKQDFNSSEMAELLGIESLAERDAAWRRLSVAPSPSHEIELDEEPNATEGPNVHTTGMRTSRGALTPSLPPTTSLPPTMAERTPVSSAQRRIPPPPPPPAPVLAATTGPQQPLPVAQSSASGFQQHVPHLVWAAVALMAVGVGAWAAHSQPSPTPSLSPSSSIQIVQTPRTPEHPAAPVDPQPAPAAALAEPAVDEPKVPRGTRAARPATPDAQELTRAFRKQQGQIAGCFEQHALGLAGVPVVTLEFSLLPDGKLAAVNVQPAALAPTPLGHCIQRVASQTHFPAQGKSLSFAIPLSASKGAGR